MIKLVSGPELGEMFDKGTQYSVLSCLQTKKGLFYVVNLSCFRERITIERKDDKLIYTIETVRTLYKPFTYKPNGNYSYKKGNNNE